MHDFGASQAVERPHEGKPILRPPLILSAFAQVPMLLILFGGATADGQHLPSYLARLQLMLTVPALALAAATASGALTFEIAVLCGVVTSIIGAFVLPARDSLIADVTPPGTAITLMVAAATSAMFAGQMTGFAIAAAASYTGLLPLLFIQIVLLAGSAILTSRVAPHAGPSRADTRAKPRRSIGQLLKDIREGLTIVAAHERLRTLTLLVSLASLANNAAFIVGLPLLVRDVYRGGSLEQAILFVAFMVGTTLSTGYLSRRKPIDQQGRTMMILFLNGAIVFACIHLGPPFWVTALLILSWGLTAGVGMVMSRSMIQAAAPPLVRGRVLSVFQMAQMLGSPIGALLLGLIIHALGILNALLVVPIWIVLLWGGFSLFTPIWRFHRLEEHANPAPAPQPGSGIAALAPPGEERREIG